MSLDTRNAELNKALEQNPIDKQVAILFKADGRRKIEIRLLFFIVVMGAILTGFVTTLALRTYSLTKQSESISSAITRSCETSNDARANNKQLWYYILNLTPAQPPTPEQEQRITEFRAFVDKTFAPRDCKAEINK